MPYRVNLLSFYVLHSFGLHVFLVFLMLTLTQLYLHFLKNKLSYLRSEMIESWWETEKGCNLNGFRSSGLIQNLCRWLFVPIFSSSRVKKSSGPSPNVCKQLSALNNYQHTLNKDLEERRGYLRRVRSLKSNVLKLTIQAVKGEVLHASSPFI